MLTSEIHHLLKNLEKIDTSQGSEQGPYLSTGKGIGKVAFVYEKIRNSLEYNEDYLLRKNAIGRMLKRRLSEGMSGEDVARPLVMELIRAKYLEDGVIPEAWLGGLIQILNRYILLRNGLIKYYSHDVEVLHQYIDVVYGFMAADVEKYLIRPYKKEAFITALYDSVKPRIVLSDQSINREDLELQVYIACIRGLHVNDEDILGLRILQLFFPEWKQASYELIDKVAHDFEHVHKQIDQTLHHRLGRVLQRKIKPSVVAFRMLEQVYEDHDLESFKKLLVESDELELVVKKVCSAEYKKVKKKLARNVFRSIIYLFLTKVLLAVIVEVPFDLFLFKEIHYLPLAINILISPLLLMLIGLFTSIPDRRNTANILMELKSLLRDSQEREVIFEIKRSYQRSKMLTFTFRALYFFAFVVSFGAIIQFLLWLHFNVLSGVLFVIFLSLVSYFGIRIKKIARDLSITSQRENILTLLLDFFSYPVVSVGQYLSQKWSKFNVLAMVFDVIIEAPLKILVEIMEEWFSYFDEKKEELY